MVLRLAARLTLLFVLVVCDAPSPTAQTAPSYVVPKGRPNALINGPPEVALGCIRNQMAETLGPGERHKLEDGSVQIVWYKDTQVYAAARFWPSAVASRNETEARLQMSPGSSWGLFDGAVDLCEGRYVPGPQNSAGGLSPAGG
jgi:hypothetical protein